MGNHQYQMRAPHPNLSFAANPMSAAFELNSLMLSLSCAMSDTVCIRF